MNRGVIYIIKTTNLKLVGEAREKPSDTIVIEVDYSEGLPGSEDDTV